MNTETFEKQATKIMGFVQTTQLESAINAEKSKNSAFKLAEASNEAIISSDEFNENEQYEGTFLGFSRLRECTSERAKARGNTHYLQHAISFTKQGVKFLLCGVQEKGAKVNFLCVNSGLTTQSGLPILNLRESVKTEVAQTTTVGTPKAPKKVK